MSVVDIRETDVIAPNFKVRLSGVTSTIIQLVPVQRRLGQRVAALGPGLPDHLPHVRFRDLWQLWQPTAHGGRRVWHARRNVEMLAGIVMRDLLRMRLSLVFTSASQRAHTSWTRFLISRMDGVIATSDRTAAYLKVPNVTILHGIDTARFAPPADKAAARAAVGLRADKQIVGCFGRIRRQKGTDLFVDAMIDLLPQRPDWIAIIAGRATGKHADFEADLKKRVAAAHLSDRILFVGEHTNIPDWYRALDLFVAPQRWEGFGLTPLEAMATGVPVVATNVGAFSELIAVGSDETGVIIPSDDLSAMIAKTGELMDNAIRRAHAAGRALDHARRNFSIEGEAEALGRVYAAAEAGDAVTT
ncbi:mannosyltransferase [Rhizobium sp. RU20A]|uniref:glycosyltransferase family 4 protein n=1 Tax=Rhizobium sp. RU20A TaxID=1907412 RepID=UPI00095749B0|nr:glycosyltransferase family 4 protein [Rhizobium sp. RU20A]SIQ25338.1 mannosyltransferase [Rhizobium sp. RU20A]